MTNEPNSKTDEPSPERRHHGVLTGICIVLAVAIAGVAWYVYPTLHNLPSVTQRLDQTVDAIGHRLREAEAKAADSSRAQKSLSGQVTDLGRKLGARIETVSRQASQSAEDTYRKLQAQAEADMRTQSEKMANVAERVSGLESSREGDQVQIAQLKQELNQVREQADQRALQQAGDLAEIRRQVEQSSAQASERLAELKRDQDRNRQDLDTFSDRIAVQKLPFEATKNQSRDLGDGLSLCIDSTDTEYRRVSGWIWIASDRRTVWLRNQSAQEPVILYGNRDGLKREVVITNVTDNSVAGYLLLPKQAAGAETGPAGE
jgi:hypothetical protein